MQEIRNQPWFVELPEKQQHLIELALTLYEREVQLGTQYFDYSFILFPMAKAYEGFLKTYFHHLGLISTTTYEGKRFRIGRALNPDIHPRGRDEFWLYDDVARRCGTQVASELWQTWLECRNAVFHFFPKSTNILTLPAVKSRLEKVTQAIALAHSCEVTHS